MKRLLKDTEFATACLLAWCTCLSVTWFVLCTALDCDGTCKCKDGGECRCFARTATCQCSSCTCAASEASVRYVDGLPAPTEEEFAKLQADLRKDIADRKKQCCQK